MITAWLKTAWRWIRREKIIEALAGDVDAYRNQRDEIQTGFRDLFGENEELRAHIARLKAEPEALRDKLRTAAGTAKRLQQRLDVYLTDAPATAEEATWTPDDSKALAHFLETNPAGKKLAQHLANRLADYDRAAVLYSTSGDAWARLKRAHGFRDCRGEILRLSAAGPLPANHETEGVALPADLEHLRA